MINVKTQRTTRKVPSVEAQKSNQDDSSHIGCGKRI